MTTTQRFATTIPVTILAGFLGAGKTTLLNYILSCQKDMRTAVVVNEFGEIGIDNELVISASEDMVELSNGCICCSINGELLNVIERILDRPDRINYLIVETTGLADPLPVAMTFLGSRLRDLTRLDSIVTVVDAENFGPRVLDSEVGRAQIIYSDLLLLNKCDLVSKERLQIVEKHLRELKTNARILYSIRGKVPMPLLLSIGLFESDRVVKDDHDIHRQHHVHQDHDHKHITITKPKHEEIDGYTSLSFQSSRPFALRKFQNFLDNQLPSDVFRAKGILWFYESERRHIFHLAGKRFSIEDSDWRSVRKNEIVLIGCHLDHITLQHQLQACVASDAGQHPN